MLEDLLPFYDELARLTALPWKEFDAQYPEFVKKAKARDPWGFDRLNEPDGIIAGVRRHETQMALFKAALPSSKAGRTRSRTSRTRSATDRSSTAPWTTGLS